MSEKAADLILKEKGMNSKDLKKDLTAYKKPLSFPLKARASFQVESRHFPNGTGYNIAGYVEGADSRLKKECVVLGGHFDHCGLHMGFHFAGANDNASGSAVVMEISEAFAGLKQKPKRSVVFVLFGGEEMGLMGSSYFVDHIAPQFKKAFAMFNFDMVGEGDGVICIHSPTPAGLKNAIEKADRHVQIIKQTRAIKGVGVRGSDHAPFFANGIPIVAFFSNGPHLYYHQTGDTIFRINPDIMASIARLAFLGAFELADM
jgi:Zn-dependent M28 family amino/carboxypeptidase